MHKCASHAGEFYYAMVGIIDTFGSGQRYECARASVSIKASERGTSLRGTPAAIDLDKFQKSCDARNAGLNSARGQDNLNTSRCLSVCFSTAWRTSSRGCRTVANREHAPCFDISRCLAVDANVAPKQFLTGQGKDTDGAGAGREQDSRSH